MLKSAPFPADPLFADFHLRKSRAKMWIYFSAGRFRRKQGALFSAQKVVGKSDEWGSQRTVWGVRANLIYQSQIMFQINRYW